MHTHILRDISHLRFTTLSKETQANFPVTGSPEPCTKSLHLDMVYLLRDVPKVI